MPETAQTPEWDADDYASHSSGQQRWALDNLSALAIEQHHLVLDIGCGDGKITAVIASRVPEGFAMGIDFSADMVRHAKQRFADVGNLGFEQMDAAAIRFPPRFDWVFSNSTLHWVPDHQAVLRGIAGALKPGGRFFLSMGGTGTISAVIAAVADFIAAGGPWAEPLSNVRSPMVYSNPEDYAQWLPAAGLQQEHLRLIAKPIVQPDREALRGWLRTTKMYYIEAIEASQQDDFLEALTDAVAARCARGDAGELLVPMVNLEAAGFKAV